MLFSRQVYRELNKVTVPSNVLPAGRVCTVPPGSSVKVTACGSRKTVPPGVELTTTADWTRSPGAKVVCTD